MNLRFTNTSMSTYVKFASLPKPDTVEKNTCKLDLIRGAQRSLGLLHRYHAPPAC